MKPVVNKMIAPLAIELLLADLRELPLEFTCLDELIVGGCLGRRGLTVLLGNRVIAVRYVHDIQDHLKAGVVECHLVISDGYGRGQLRASDGRLVLDGCRRQIPGRDLNWGAAAPA